MRRSERLPVRSAAEIAEAESLNLLSLMSQQVAKGRRLMLLLSTFAVKS